MGYRRARGAVIEGQPLEKRGVILGAGCLRLRARRLRRHWERVCPRYPCQSSSATVTTPPVRAASTMAQPAAWS